MAGNELGILSEEGTSVCIPICHSETQKRLLRELYLLALLYLAMLARMKVWGFYNFGPLTTALSIDYLDQFLSRNKFAWHEQEGNHDTEYLWRGGSLFRGLDWMIKCLHYQTQGNGCTGLETLLQFASVTAEAVT
ncbi:hypothetical protein GOP47_0002746 [Adiantum capillus-veneris]|uniref:Uncharacterized protein n=1 Tax=Adiantum capillus-veneris TaxID=13818 RepID=A0A9D4ZPF1_ADICA|nr:hypothetical protein GOP47_0002746 [Adiantum capillus-veneris]